MSKWQVHHAAARRGRRMAQAEQSGRKFRGNPYGYNENERAHRAWASAYLSERLRLETVARKA